VKVIISGPAMWSVDNLSTYKDISLYVILVKVILWGLKIFIRKQSIS